MLQLFKCWKTDRDLNSTDPISPAILALIKRWTFSKQLVFLGKFQISTTSSTRKLNFISGLKCLQKKKRVFTSDDMDFVSLKLIVHGWWNRAREFRTKMKMKSLLTAVSARCPLSDLVLTVPLQPVLRSPPNQRKFSGNLRVMEWETQSRLFECVWETIQLWIINKPWRFVEHLKSPRWRMRNRNNRVNEETLET